MIYGIGIDLISVARIDGIWRRAGTRFAERVLSPLEMHEFSKTGDRSRWLAKRWAAKEAFAKAAGIGMREPIKWRSVSIVHDELGRPSLEFSPIVLSWLAAHNITRSHLSISDERELVCAYALLETNA